MMNDEHLIMVVDQSTDRAEALKALIEFMDAPEVCTATPGNWRSRVGEQRLAAIFVSKELPEKEISSLLDNVGKLDPNVPIVLVKSQQHA